MIRYIVTTDPGASGAYLSRCGSWTNMPHTSVEAARLAAAADAAGKEYTIERDTVKRRASKGA